MFEALQLVQHRGAADWVQGSADHDRPTDGGGGVEVDVVEGLAGVLGLFCFGIDALAPVPDDPGGRREPQPGALLHEEGFVAGQVGGTVGLVGPAEQIEVIERELASPDRGHGRRQAPLLPGPAHLDPGGGR